MPSYEDLCDIITIGAVSKGKMSEITGGGFFSRFQQRSEAFQKTVQISLLISSVLILAIYSYVVYTWNKSKLGLITSVSVVLMDIYNFLLFKSGMIEKPIGIVFMFIVNRILFVSFGEGYWIYGYMCLYICYSVTFGWLIAKKHFPFEGDVILENAKLSRMKTMRGKALEKY